MRAQPVKQGDASSSKLIIFDTHPIQYRSPVFNALNQIAPETQVYFFSESFSGQRWWFREYDKSPRDSFNIPLKKGFQNKTLKYRGPFSFIAQIRKIIGKEKPTAVLIYGYYLWEHWAVLLATKLSRTPLFFIGETFSAQGGGARDAIKRFILPILFGAFAQIITIGKKNRRHYEGLGISKRKLTDAHYCVDGNFFEIDPTQAARARERVRQQHGIPPDAFLLIFVGRLFDRKRPMDAVEIHQLLCSTHPNLYTLIVGTGELESPLRQQMAATPRLMMAGFLDQKAIRDVYYASDCLLITSEFETWGLVANEALHCGLAVGVTDTCGVAEDLIVPGETGFVYKVRDLHSAAKQLAGLIDNPKLLHSLACAGKKKVTTEYNVNQFAEAIKLAVGKVRP